MSPWPKLFVFLIWVALGSLAGANFVYPGSPWASVAWLAAIGGAAALAVCLCVARGAERPFGTVDAARCAGWTLIGCGLAIIQFTDGYYPRLGRQDAQLVKDCALWSLVLGLSIIVYASLFPRIAGLPKPGHCRQCGYNLTGNTSGICPECGTPTDGATSSDPPCTR